MFIFILWPFNDKRVDDVKTMSNCQRANTFLVFKQIENWVKRQTMSFLSLALFQWNWQHFYSGNEIERNLENNCKFSAHIFPMFPVYIAIHSSFAHRDDFTDVIYLTSLFLMNRIADCLSFDLIRLYGPILKRWIICYKQFTHLVAP